MEEPKNRGSLEEADKDGDRTLMIPRWLLGATRNLHLGNGAALVYGCLLYFARGEPEEFSTAFTIPADISRVVGLSTGQVRRILRALERVGLIQRFDRQYIFLRHSTIPDWHEAVRGGVGALNVQHRWNNDAFFLPRIISSIPANELSAGAKVFWALVYRYTKRSAGVVYAYQRTLAKELRLSVRQIQKHTATLESLGLVEVKDLRRYGRANQIVARAIAPRPGLSRQEARHLAEQRARKRLARFK